MPYPNEHACRVRTPDDFQPESFRRMKSGKVHIVVGRLKGEDSTTTQAFRYPTDDWTVAEARAHCAEQEGAFEPASNAVDSEIRRRAR